jgi:hypothetical protein
MVEHGIITTEKRKALEKLNEKVSAHYGEEKVPKKKNIYNIKMRVDKEMAEGIVRDDN